MSSVITMTSEKDVKAVRLYIFDSVKREEVDELVLLMQIFCEVNTDFSFDSFPALCQKGIIGVDVVSKLTKEQAVPDMVKFMNSKGIRSPRLIVQAGQIKVPGKLFKKETLTEIWLVTLVDKAFANISGMQDTEIIFYANPGGIRLIK